MNRRFQIYNFGCKVNQEEGGALAALFSSLGWEYVQEEEPADLVIVNTCTVTAVADKKARNLLRRLRRENPGCVLAACGCYAQRDPETMARLGVDVIAGVDERRRLPELVEKYLQQQQAQPIQAVGRVLEAERFQSIAPVSDQRRARAYLKVEDGCDQFCNYCIIPYVRGPVRSLPMEQALAEAERLVEAGHLELVLTGIHIGAYGTDLPQEENLPELLRQLCAIPGLARLRIGSVEPQQFTPELIDTLSGLDKLCPHLHIPLQSGCDKTLAAMGRRYDTATYARLLEKLRSCLGDLAFTTDVMVGYPGESEEDFLASQEFCRDCGFADMHVFPYSRREGTPAAIAPQQVQQAEKAERAARLAETASQGQLAYARRYLGRELTMLAEEEVELEGKRYLKGHSDNYLLLYLPQGIPERRGLLSVRSRELLADGLLVESLR